MGNDRVRVQLGLLGPMGIEVPWSRTEIEFGTNSTGGWSTVDKMEWVAQTDDMIEGVGIYSPDGQDLLITVIFDAATGPFMLSAGNTLTIDTSSFNVVGEGARVLRELADNDYDKYDKEFEKLQAKLRRQAEKGELWA